ncbi:MAG: 2'-5' RNA ligase family protein [Candidatus Roizmanbacteria bacterium]
MKVYLAIKIPEQAILALSKQLQEWKNEYRYFNWVKPERYQMILHTFGVIDTEDVEAIKKKIYDAIFEESEFELFTRSADMFIKSNISIYINFQRERKLTQLVRRIRLAFGINSAYDFVPHIEIAKYKIPSKQQYLAMKRVFENSSFEAQFPVNEIFLFERNTDGVSPGYTELTSFPLLLDKRTSDPIEEQESTKE